MIVHWSPDGTRILTEDGGIWDAKTGEELQRLPAEIGATYGGTGWPWSPDGARIVTSRLDEPVRIWDAATGEELLTFERPGGARLARWSPTGNHILTMDPEAGPAKVWDAEIGTELFQLPGTGLGTWSPDGQYLATDGDVGEVKAWEVATGAVRLSFTAHSGAVVPDEWLPSGERFITSSGDGSAKVWDVSQALSAFGCRPTCDLSASSLVARWPKDRTWLFRRHGCSLERGFRR
jgi:WD40 repeat protein